GRRIRCGPPGPAGAGRGARHDRRRQPAGRRDRGSPPRAGRAARRDRLTAAAGRLAAMDLPAPWGHAWAGRLHEHVIDSQALTGNPLGDPHRRPLWVYTPPGYAEEPDRRYPSIYVI